MSLSKMARKKSSRRSPLLLTQAKIAAEKATTSTKHDDEDPQYYPIPSTIRESPSEYAQVDHIYVVTPDAIDRLTDHDMSLGVGADTRDAPSSVAVRRFVSRFKKVFRTARKSNRKGPGESKRTIIIRIVLGLKMNGFRIIDKETHMEVPFKVAHKTVWKMIRDKKRCTLPDHANVTNLDAHLPPSPGLNHMNTYSMPECVAANESDVFDEMIEKVLKSLGEP